MVKLLITQVNFFTVLGHQDDLSWLSNFSKTIDDLQLNVSAISDLSSVNSTGLFYSAIVEKVRGHSLIT